MTGSAVMDHTALLPASLPASYTQPTVSRWRHRTVRAAFIGMAALSVFVGAFSYRYLIPQARVTLAPLAVANFFARPFLYVHAGCAATALIVGPFQFIQSLRRTHLQLHRIMGRVYVLCCMVGGAAALPLGATATSGPIARSGFLVLAVLWLVINGNGWRLAVQGRIAEHKLWMIRSFALTFGAVTLRLFIFVLPVFGVPFHTAYVIASWGAWLPNLLIVDAWMWYQNRTAAAVEEMTAATPGEVADKSGQDKAESLIASNETS